MSAARGEGLAGLAAALVAKWREWNFLGMTPLTCADELEKALEAAARLPSVGQAPPSTPTWDDAYAAGVKLNKLVERLATPSPQPSGTQQCHSLSACRCCFGTLEAHSLVMNHCQFCERAAATQEPAGSGAAKGEAMNPAIKIINSYIQMLQAGHVKEGLREASKEESEFATALLQAIAADIEALPQ